MLVSKDDEIERLRAEVTSMRRLLSDAVAEDGSFEVTSATTAVPAASSTCGWSLERPDVERSRAASFVLCDKLGRCFERNPDLVNEKVVFDIGCGGGAVSCLCARLGADRVLADETSSQSRSWAALVIDSNHMGEEVTLVPAPALEEAVDQEFAQELGIFRGKGQGACDLLLSQRLVSDLRYTPWLFSVLHARRLHLRPGGRVLPGRLRLLAVAANAGSCDGHSSSSDAWRRPAFGGLNLSALAPRIPRADRTAELLASCVTSKEPAEVCDVDLTIADQEDLLPKQKLFTLELRPSTCTTAVALYIDAFLDAKDSHPENLISMAPPESRGDAFQARQVLLHLPAFAPSGGVQSVSQPMALEGDVFSVLQGAISANLAANGALQLCLELSATRRDGEASVPALKLEVGFEL